MDINLSDCGRKEINITGIWYDMTILIHESKKAEDLFLKDSTIPEPSSTDNVDFNFFQTIIKRQLEVGETDKWKKIVNTYMGFSEDNFKGINHMYTIEKTVTNHQNW